ncbi:hypothetical protein [Bradymonas sediminis]|uniref:Uncharacterized protein n=1 Tax=Bradymonas sediminis TaxID=1548548 RepID=A0A2Z4FNS0_9DELT|nr:hypothetical protein [Bradymonas sediminis]AWV90629.1 hypothetical protein DN745_15380 [Bradymonas sediminis]TDP62369.1 hypothetical protein DFR33_11332 [Bradymonas sediminis]
MKTQFRLIFLMSALALSTLSLVGCGGPECGDGTTEKDGECVADLGGDGSTCGAGTVSENGVCVPAPEVCGPMTTPDEDGRCVVSPDACEAGETLDPNSGVCVAGDRECAPGTVFDGSSNSCVPTSEVCDEGTVFNEDSGLCLPGFSCSVGDVIVDGFCVSPAEDLVSKADVTEVENNDPAFGGTAQALTLKGLGDATIFKGTIGAPVDLDEDGELDQDIDVFTFEAVAGDWFELSMQSTGMPSPIFRVKGPNGYLRSSPAIAGHGSARQVVVPADGAYTLEVLPLSSEFSDFAVRADDWGYVGSLTQIDTPVRAEFNLNANHLIGDYGSLSDHYYSITGYDAGDLVTIRVQASEPGAQGILTLWNSETELVTAAPLSVAGSIDAVIPASGELFAVVDWASMQTTGASFELSSQRAENYEYVGVLGDDEATTTTPQDIPRYGDFQYVFTVNAGQVIEIAQNNAEGETVKTTLRGASGDIVLDSASQQAGTSYRYWYSETGGTYILHLDNSSSFYSSNITEATVTVTTATPKDLGAFEVGETLSESASELLEAKRSEFYLLSLDTPATISGEVSTPNGENLDLHFLDASNAKLASFRSSGVEVVSDEIVPAGTMLLQIEAVDEVPSYEMNFTFADAPDYEVEPNDTAANATPLDLNKGMIGISSDVDIFAINLDADLADDEVLVFQLDQEISGFERYTSVLRDSSDAEVSVTYPEAVQDGYVVLASDLVASQTYYLETSRQGGVSDKKYRLSGRVETGLVEVEPNESEAAATSFELDALLGGASVFGYVPYSYDTDYYMFELAADQPLDQIITFSVERLGANPTSSASWQLLDGALNRIAGGVMSNDLVLSNAPQGAYYLEVKRSSNAPEYSVAADAWKDELNLTLISPEGTELELHRAADGSTQKSLVGRYPDTLTPHGGPLSVFHGQVGTGEWVLTVGYNCSTDSTFNSLGIELVCD